MKTPNKNDKKKETPKKKKAKNLKLTKLEERIAPDPILTGERPDTGGGPCGPCGKP